MKSLETLKKASLFAILKNVFNDRELMENDFIKEENGK